MNPAELITELESLETLLNRRPLTDLGETFSMTTRIILAGLKKPQRDESVVVDGIAHLKQAQRLWEMLQS
jgi:hypothetical protein